MSSSTVGLTCCCMILGYVAIAFVGAKEISECYSLNNDNYCFYTSDTNDTMSSWDEAREFCVRRNSTLPIITDENIDNVFQRFIVNDANSVLLHRSVWLDSRRVNGDVNWHWINGQSSALTSLQSSNHSGVSFASIGTNKGQSALYGSGWTERRHYICQYDRNSDISSPSATNDNCSPRWIVYPNLQAAGASHNGAQTQRQCLDACVRDAVCATAEWDRNTQTAARCWIHRNDITTRIRSSTITQFEIIRRCYTTFSTGVSCDDAFQLNSTCYKVHKNERVNWFTAVNRCLSYNASLAAFDDNVLQYFPSSVLSESQQAWIGLVNSLWMWPGSANCWIEAQAYGGPSGDGFVKMNNITVWETSRHSPGPQSRGVNILLVEPFNCSLLESRNFDTYYYRAGAAELSTYLQQVSHGVIIVGVTADEPTRNLASALPALQQLGVDVSDVRFRGSFAFVAQKGFPANTKLRKTLNGLESKRNKPHISVNITDDVDVLYNKFKYDSSSSQHSNSDYNCAVATADHWRVVRCDERHHVVCQSDYNTLPETSITTVATSSTADETAIQSLIVGLCVVVLFVVVAIIVVVVVVVLRRRRPRSSSTEQRDVQDHNDGREYEEMRSRDTVLYSQLNQPRNDAVNVVNSKVQHPSADQQYEELKTQNAMNAGVMYSQLHPSTHSAVQHHTTDGNYEEIDLS